MELISNLVFDISQMLAAILRLVMTTIIVIIKLGIRFVKWLVAKRHRED